MKILLGADQYPEYINGAATFTARLAAGLARRGHTVDLLWPAADGRHATSLQDGVRVHRLSSLALPGRPRMQVCSPWTASRQVAQIIEVARPDVVHVQSHLTLGRALVKAAAAAGVPVLATNHFMPDNLLPHVPVVRRFPSLASRLAWRDLERVFAAAGTITAPTRRAVDLLASSTDLPPAEVVSCGLDVEAYRCDRRRPRRSGPTVLFVGRLEPEKHVDELLVAFARLPVGLGARLEIVGMGSLRSRLEAQARVLGLGGSVTFRGAVSDEELLRCYAEADLFVMPGTAELQSLATLEAMASGLPVVAADAMALPHLVHAGRNGHLYAPGDVAGLHVGVLDLLDHPTRRQAFGATSRRIAAQHSLDATLTRFEQLYVQLVGGRLSVAPATPAGLALAS